jgi:hypothetical protein
MSDSWSQATGVWQLYSEALAGLGQHLTEQTWQSFMTELRDCTGKIVVTGVGTSGIAARKVAHCWPASNARQFTSMPPTPLMATWVFYAQTIG